MTRDEALVKAREFADARGWSWREPVQAESFHPWWVGPLRWRIRTNAGQLGMNVFVEIDDRTGHVVKANFVPR